MLGGVFYAHRPHQPTEPVIARRLSDFYPSDVRRVELPHMLRDATDRFLREDAAFVTLDEVRTLSAHLKKVTGSRGYKESFGIRA